MSRSPTWSPGPNSSPAPSAPRSPDISVSKSKPPLWAVLMWRELLLLLFGGGGGRCLAFLDDLFLDLFLDFLDRRDVRGRSGQFCLELFLALGGLNGRDDLVGAADELGIG